MAGLLSISSRNLPRTALRISGGLRSLEGSSQQVSVRKEGKVLRKYWVGCVVKIPSSIAVNNGLRSYHQGRAALQRLVRATVAESAPIQSSTVASNAASRWLQTERSIFTSARLLNSEVVKVPPFADSVSEGDVKFEKKVGDAVAADEVVMEIETDKTTVGVPAPAHGIIEEIYVADGDTVKAGQQLFKLKITGEAPAAGAPKAEAPAPAAAAPPPPPPPPPVAAAAAAAPPPPPPAAAAAPPPPPPRPTGPITKMPVAAMRHAQAIDAATVKLPPADYTKEITGTRTEQRVKMTRMRLKIASRLKEAQNTNAMLTTFNEIDMR
ncbi:hypothetical protein RP20_CCG017523 [Aedes albopictus]|nr:hypothetical protein RP20_CCG017523 [Aedes albopictus]